MTQTQRVAFASISLLFFLFGFITCLNSILIPHLKVLFDLNFRQSMFIQFAFFSAYFFFSLPSGQIVRKYGYAGGIILGLSLSGLGALGFLPAGYFHSYPLFLGTLFVMACGITLLQVAANPYVSALGPLSSAPVRLNLAQAYNSLGTTLAPLLGSYLILSSTAAGPSPQNTALPYLFIACTLFLLAFVFRKLSLPEITDDTLEDARDDTQTHTSPFRLSQYPRLCFGIVGIFCYVGAEIGIGSTLVDYIIASWSVDAARAGQYVAIYWSLAMVGRFLGVYFLKRFHPASCLAFASAVAAALVIVSVLVSTDVSPCLLMAVGMFNSILFPVTFSVSIEGLGRHTSLAASYLCMAIVGGALIPVLQGWVSDGFGLKVGFLVPFLSYIYLTWFAAHVRCSKPVPLNVESGKNGFSTN